jgi:hypothetical protein
MEGRYRPVHMSDLQFLGIGNARQVGRLRRHTESNGNDDPPRGMDAGVSALMTRLKFLSILGVDLAGVKRL